VGSDVSGLTHRNYTELQELYLKYKKDGTFFYPLDFLPQFLFFFFRNKHVLILFFGAGVKGSRFWHFHVISSQIWSPGRVHRSRSSLKRSTTELFLSSRRYVSLSSQCSYHCETGTGELQKEIQNRSCSKCPPPSLTGRQCSLAGVD
jgi:hypothetical protein